jgi:hypothetical protein
MGPNRVVERSVFTDDTSAILLGRVLDLTAP